MNQEIHLDQPGQLFVHDPPTGLPAAPIEVSVEAPNGAIEDQATIGAPAVDGFASVLVEDSPSGAPWLTILDTAGLGIGRRYLVGAPPHFEWVIVTEIRAPRVTLRRRLVHSFRAGATLRGCRLSIGVNPEWQREQARRIELGGIGIGAYRAKWSYRVDAVATRAVDHVDLVFAPRAGVVTPDDVERRYPGWLDTLPSEHVATRGTEVILEAHDLVQRDAARANVNLNNAVETRELVELRARMVTIEHEVLYGKRPPAELDAAETRYHSRAAELWSQLHQVAPVPRSFTKTSRSDNQLEELRRWFQASRAGGISQWKQLQLLREKWLSRFQTAYERWEAARVIREYITSRRLLGLREAMLRELE